MKNRAGWGAGSKYGVWKLFFFFLRWALLKYACLLIKHWKGVSDSPRGDEFRAQMRGWFSVSRGTVLPSVGEGRGDR